MAVGDRSEESLAICKTLASGKTLRATAETHKVPIERVRQAIEDLVVLVEAK